MPPGKMKTYPTFAAWYQARSTGHKKIVSKLRKLVSEVAPKLVESSKWTNGVWLKDELPIIYIHTEPDHVQFGFFAGATFTDPRKILKGKGNHVRHIRIENIEDIDEKALATMIRKAIRAPAYK
jgi:hypothetical protein